LEYDIWEAIQNGYNAPTTPLIGPTDKKAYENNLKAKNANMCGLVDSDTSKSYELHFGKRNMGQVEKYS